MDESGEAIPFANVVLLDQSGKNIISGNTSDFQGEFEIKAAEGQYQLKISFLSFKEKLIAPLVLEKNLNLGKVVLEPSALELEEVTIAESKNIMEMKLDKRVFNVGSDLSNAGGNAADVLDNVPSVTVDVEGNVSLRGSENVRILINGKPSGLVGSSTSDALRQLQGNQIERVEVVTNPSARYDAEGEVGIINIVLKKNQKQGTNGSFELAVGYPKTLQASGNLNYRTDKANYFGSYGIRNSEFPGGGNSYQRYLGPDTSYIYESIGDRTRGGISHNFRLGAEFFIDTSNTISTSVLYSLSDRENLSNLVYKDYDVDQPSRLISSSERKDVENEVSHDLEASVNYKKTFKRKGQELSIDLQATENDDTEKSIITETSSDSEYQLLQRSSNIEDENNQLFQADYLHPFSENGLVEFGVKSTFRNINNDFSVEEQNPNGEYVLLDDFNNNFIYTENIYASYLMAGNKYRDISYQLGLRTEYSDITTEMKKNQNENQRKYLNFFPSAHLSYELNKTNTFQLSYSRRISRPRFRHLLPFFSFSDNRSFRSGNPDLQPEFTDAFETGYLKYFDKGSVLSSIYYRRTTGVVEWVNVQDSEGFIRRSPVNLSIEDSYGLEFNANYEISKSWKVNGNFNFYRSITEGEYLGQKLHSDNYSWMSRLSSKFSLPHKIDFQLSGFYRAPQQTTQGRRRSMAAIDAAFSKDILKGNGTLVLSIRDLLNSRKWRGITETEYLYSESEFQWRSRSVLLSFTYRLNQKKKQNSNRDSGMDSDDAF